MQAKHTASDLSMDFPLLRIGKTVFEKKTYIFAKSIETFQSASKIE